jgi:hypothetical protein
MRVPWANTNRLQAIPAVDRLQHYPDNDRMQRRFALTPGGCAVRRPPRGDLSR